VHTILFVWAVITSSSEARRNRPIGTRAG
jgi:hypothetical protein